MSAELFLEIGTEEIPAGFIPRALADIERLLCKELEAARITYGAVRTFATPRRLAISLADVAKEQQRQELELTGPPARIAFDADGKPTKAAEGFARTNGVSVDELQTIETEKGEYLFLSKVIEGGESAEQMPEILAQVVSKIQFKKSMRWKDLDVRFARPVHWLVALFDGEVVPFSFGDLQSGSLSRGHRFMAPQEFSVTGADDYIEKAEAQHVIPQIEKRRQMISEQLETLAKELGGKINPDDELLEEVSFLVETPQALAGSIEERFLQLPPELLITSMREHQRYFTLIDDNSKLLPHFITIANTLAKDPKVVIAGNERVLRARLSDAMFFWEEDQKQKLEARLEPLKKVVYQAKLGTSFEKIERFTVLASGLAEQLSAADLELTKRASLLAKCDLETGMVYEFPELQGVMGREYAKIEGEDPRVATAIFEHYLPTQAGGELPSDHVGAFVSLADKIDSICGCFSVGLIPTGTADPYALRRAAIGILAIILDRGYAISIPELVEKSVALLEAKRQRPAEEIVADVVEFIRLRLVNMLTSQDYPADVVDSVLSAAFTEPVDAVERVKALAALKGREDFEPLSVAFKRVGNIIKGGLDQPVDTDLFEADCEKELFAQLQQVETKVAELVAGRDYPAALETIAGLRAPVDAFFDGVMVMAEDQAVKNNRLALLTSIAGLFKGIADFSRIA
ncbi:glycyl-tRNA synthetase beta chain [Malonomonas rubra DSM 5091]|uniref:Glycine--tRNA ligase beta subunit n=1 Tax=Malonomonas rubra DSM 5091 TaxID=1122189 RepID=A0A1M6MUQ4_MALRU|nr:glycine--tRNA ligase subunit beta [Malonomonas rubra]SHJ87130.1 glycyl-tRNA synthetase beta chain [Malonomonas rubra DSM 5091]